MTKTSYIYTAYCVLQTPTSKPLILFAAPAPEVGQWVGIPQRGRLDGGETVGFQRQENEARVRELAGFFGEPRNVVQNALLCALQDSAKVSFKPSEANPSFGELVIEAEALEELHLLELINHVIARLESRVPTLATQPIDPARQAEVLRKAVEIHDLVPVEEGSASNADNEDSGVDEEGMAGEPDDVETDVGAVLLTEETQLIDFHQELRTRAEALARMPEGSDPFVFLGFSKAAMISYLQPVVLVDGQHRLRGAIRSAEDAANSEEGRQTVREAIDDGADPDAANQALIATHSRQLPVSLLMDESPSEHVFQFVVVNQKATPMGKALLGTIVSTSLSREELEPVADRLRKAGIHLEDSQAVAYLTRAIDSPFRGVVQTGVVGDEGSHLQWSVLKGLTSIFRELRGGKLFGQANDYADVWRRRWLAESGFVADASSSEQMYTIWSAPDGPWRQIFVRFFTLVRQRFADDDPGAHNAWGNTASNLFNKVSLTILAADYFQFLCDSRRTLSSLPDVDESVDEWLEGVNLTYFSRDWRLSGIKKDVAAVQKTWASLWIEYRKDPMRLPTVTNYRPK